MHEPTWLLRRQYEEAYGGGFPDVSSAMSLENDASPVPYLPDVVNMYCMVLRPNSKEGDPSNQNNVDIS